MWMDCSFDVRDMYARFGIDLNELPSATVYMTGA